MTEAISSLQTLQNSIVYDFYTSCWFHNLLSQPAVKECFARRAPETTEAYQRYRKISQVTQLPLLGVCLSLILVFISRHYAFLVISCGFLLLYFRFVRNQRQILARLSSVLLRQEFAVADFSGRTLYEITEHLGRQYGIPSMVDTIYRSDNILRRLFLLGFFLPWPDFGRSVLIFFVVYFSCKYLLNSRIGYRILAG